MIDDDLENSGLRELIEKGREQGYITFADINDYLPDEVLIQINWMKLSR